ncbi:MAG: hypothetical protein JWO22_944, partial [Frankiales bacterium]|nr:hypothetical protein [Frankiales bacterium]
DEYREFLSEMHAAVYEESPLYELPGGVTDLLPNGPVVHGPWLAEDCSRVMSHWHELGLLELYRYHSDGTTGPTVASDDARALLRDPSSWPGSGPGWDALVAVCVTEAGANLSFEDWLRSAARPVG